MEAMLYPEYVVMPDHALQTRAGGIAILQALCTILQKARIHHSLRARLCYAWSSKL
jgi:hypothetical protein